MSTLLEIEEESKDLPLLLLYSENEAILEILLDEFSSKFRIILIAKTGINKELQKENIFLIDKKNIALLPKLKEKIDYALILTKGEITQQDAIPLLEKLGFDKAKTLIVSDVFYFQNTLDFLASCQRLSNVLFCSVGEVLDRKSFDTRYDLSKIIENVIANGEITLTGNEIFPVYGNFKDDFLLGIFRLLFGNFKSDLFYFLFYEHPQTILETTHSIGHVDHDIKISFSDSAKPAPHLTRADISNLVKQRLSLTVSYVPIAYEGFEKGYAILLEHKEELIVQNKKPLKKRKKAGALGKYASFISISLFGGSFLFLFVNLLCLGIAFIFLKNALANASSDNLREASKNAIVARSFLDVTKPSVSLGLEALSVTGKGKGIERQYLLLGRVVNLLQLTGSTNDLFAKNSPDSNKLSSILSNLSYIYQEGQLLASETNNADLKKKLKPSYSKMLSFTSVLPYITGYLGERNYLLLFQNNDELRPTGGFIGSIGDLTVKKGRVENLSIQDVYELDGQLRNHVEPPFIVRRYLQPHLYLRDSNFSLNFQEAASKSAFLYNLESGKRPDGVIAINLAVLKEILKVSGPVALPQYNVTVNSENVSDFIQSTIKNNFFPGSTQKKDILNSVLNQLVLKATSDQRFDFALLRLLPDLLEQKNIMFSFNSPSIQNVFSANKFAGEVNIPGSSDPKDISDFLYINEANIGANKANASVIRKVNYEAMIEQGRVVSKAKLSLTNKGKEDYKVYLQYAVPKGSSLIQLLINNVKQNLTAAVTDFKVYEAKNFKAPEGIETEQYINNNTTIIAFVITAKLGQTTDVEIDYQNGSGKNLSTVARYLLTYIKQPGTDPYDLTTTLDYPEGYIPVNTKADSYGKNFLEETKKIEGDTLTTLELQKASVQK